MKKLGILLVCLLVLPLTVNAGHIGDFYQTINVGFSCDNCDDQDNVSVTVKLFADGVEVENSERTLTKAEGLTTKYEELNKFTDDNIEINYEVKYLKDGEYVSIPSTDIKYKKETINRWVSVEVQDLQPGHDYVLLTDNWNQEVNGFSKRVVLRGDVTVKGAKPMVDYKLVDGKKSYFSLEEDPVDNSLWHFEKAEDDANFTNYWTLTDEIGKNLALSGFDKGDWVNYIFRYTGKPTGWVDSKDAMNTNKVTFIPVENKHGKFYIASKNVWEGTYEDTMNYLGLDGYNQVVAQQVLEYGAQFLAFEHIEKEVENVLDVDINMELCEAKVYHNITSRVEGKGSIAVVDKAMPDEKITFRVSPEEGNELKSIIVVAADGTTITYELDDMVQNDDGTITISVNSFTMPDNDVEITAVFGAAQENPQTLDKLTAYVGVFALSLFGLTALVQAKKYF